MQNCFSRCIRLLSRCLLGRSILSLAALLNCHVLQVSLYTSSILSATETLTILPPFYCTIASITQTSYSACNLRSVDLEILRCEYNVILLVVKWKLFSNLVLVEETAVEKLSRFCQNKPCMHACSM